MSRSIIALAEATRRRRENAENAVRQALAEARKTGKPVTVAGTAAAAGVSPDFIYRHPELRSTVEALRRARRYPAKPSEDHPDSQAADSPLVRRLFRQLAELRCKHREEVAELRRALEAAHGELLALRRQLQAQSAG
jgi:Family of unknown function (DUF6262)